MESSSKKLVVVTPVRNEAWRISHFLESSLEWADHVVLSDQGSTDETVEIASRFDRVTILHNQSTEFNELDNRNRLLDKVRADFGKCIVFSLDADECLSAGILTEGIRSSLACLPEGTGIRIPHANLVDQSYWRVELDPIAFVDDGRLTTVTSNIHFPRTCFNEFPGGTVDVGLFALHLQYLDKTRYASKIDWYQVLEISKLGRKDLVGLFRQYHHFDSLSKRRLKPLPADMTRGYEQRGIQPLGFTKMENWWWENSFDAMLRDLSPQTRARLILHTDSEEGLPLRSVDKMVRFYLRKTQRFYRPSYLNPVFVALYFVDHLARCFWRAGQAPS